MFGLAKEIQGQIQDSLMGLHIYKGGGGFDLLIQPDYLLIFLIF